MPWDKSASQPFAAPNIRHEEEARLLFRTVLQDAAAAQQAAAVLLKLSRTLAAVEPQGVTPEQIAGRFYQKIVRDPTTGQGRLPAAQAAAVSATLDEMRELNRAAYASPQARRAHLEVEAASPRDDPRSLLETPDGRTRAEHAGYLHQHDPELRDLYERGAIVTGTSVIIPRDANSQPDAANQVKLGTLAHAVQTFTPLVGEAQARTHAAEFVALGRDIAGRTADGEARLVVFGAYYRRLQRDDTGRLLPAAEQAARLDAVLAEMRPVATAMREQEWTREPETITLDDWERGLEARQRAHEHEPTERLTYRLDEAAELDLDDAHAAPERAAADGREEELLLTSGTNTNNVSYERRSFAGQPPRLPDHLTPAETTRLRYDIIPYLDRQLENGVSVPRLTQNLARRFDEIAYQEQAETIARVLQQRAPAAQVAHPVTRAENARALYTLHALGVMDAPTIRQNGFTAQERAAALDTVGGRLAQDFRAQTGRLREFARLEQERETLAQTAADYAQQQRTTPEFLHLRTQERALGQSANVAETAARNGLRAQLAALLINPTTARAQAENAQQLAATARHLSQLAGTPLTTAQEARAALAPNMREMRAALDTLTAERATLAPGRTTPPAEKYSQPLYVARPAQSGLRLAMENQNEYRVLMAAAANLKVTVQPYAGLSGPPLVSESPARAATLDFARDYLQYRLSDPVTRLRHNSQLFREFDTRLNQARSPEELRQTLKDVRQENYARARTPERFAHETADGATVRRPLNGVEMRHLLLAEAPSHYTPEMREVRREASLSARAKEQRVQDLAQGRVAPTPALQTLLDEFGRTQARQPAQTARNINAFLSDYLNPPTPHRTRFSRHNLHDLQQQIAPAERDYLYQVISQARANTLRAPAPSRAPVPNREPVPSIPARAPAVPIRPEPTPAPDVPPATKPTLRAVLEERITHYLTNAVKTHGVHTLADPRASEQHAAQVSRLVKETFAEQKVPLARYQLTEERLTVVAGQLVGTLAHALPARDKALGADHEALRQPNMPQQSDSRALTPAASLATVRQATRAAVTPLVERPAESLRPASERSGWAAPSGATSPVTPVLSAPHRPQDLAAASQLPPDSRTALRR